MEIFRGCGVAIVTPFREDESLDEERFRQLIEWQIDEGIDAIVVCGTTGEASCLDDDEHGKRRQPSTGNMRFPRL